MNDHYWVIETYRYGTPCYWTAQQSETLEWSSHLKDAIKFNDETSGYQVMTELKVAQGYGKVTEIDYRPKPAGGYKQI